MIFPGKRVTVMENGTDEPVEVSITLSPTNSVYRRISIAPRSSSLVAVSWFRYSPSNPDRTRIISVSVGGSPSGKLLTGLHFITYGKIVLARDLDGALLLSGIKPRWTDFGRIKGFGCIFGRRYENRSREMIA